jgi:serine/threonine protein kinase
VRDIKLENVLLQTPPVQMPGQASDETWLLKICDFGYSKSELKSGMKSQVGTLVYMAPEILQGRGTEYDGKAADIWSCGIMLCDPARLRQIRQGVHPCSTCRHASYTSKPNTPHCIHPKPAPSPAPPHLLSICPTPAQHLHNACSTPAPSASGTPTQTPPQAPPNNPFT